MQLHQLLGQRGCRAMRRRGARDGTEVKLGRVLKERQAPVPVIDAEEGASLQDSRELWACSGQRLLSSHRSNEHSLRICFPFTTAALKLFRLTKVVERCDTLTSLALREACGDMFTSATGDPLPSVGRCCTGLEAGKICTLSVASFQIALPAMRRVDVSALG